MNKGYKIFLGRKLELNLGVGMAVVEEEWMPLLLSKAILATEK